jgi:hypothetical protein
MAAQRYQMPENSNFGAYLEELNITDFDPHGFVADSEVGDPIVSAVLHRDGFVPAAEWTPHATDGTWRLPFFATADAAAKGGPAIGEVIRTPAPAEDATAG